MAKKKNHYFVLVMTGEGAKFVTKVNYSTKTAEWDMLQNPLEMSREQAQDLTLGLNMNFNVAYCVEARWEIDNQPYRYSEGKFAWKWNESEGENDND